MWNACERIGIRPPNVKECWDDCDVNTQAELLAYSEIRDYEEQEVQKVMIEASGAKII